METGPKLILFDGFWGKPLDDHCGYTGSSSYSLIYYDIESLCHTKKHSVKSARTFFLREGSSDKIGINPALLRSILRREVPVNYSVKPFSFYHVLISVRKL